MINLDVVRNTMYPTTPQLDLQARMAVRLARLQVAVNKAKLPQAIHNEYQRSINRLREYYGLGGCQCLK